MQSSGVYTEQITGEGFIPVAMNAGLRNDLLEHGFDGEVSHSQHKFPSADSNALATRCRLAPPRVAIGASVGFGGTVA
jgi:hypothetical protein